MRWSLPQKTNKKNKTKLEDLGFPDDISLLSHKQQYRQTKLTRLSEVVKTGLTINTKKTELMHINNQARSPTTPTRNCIIKTDRFTYLVSIVSKDGGADKEARSRINKVRLTFHTLRPIWNIVVISHNVKSVLLYRSDTWRVTNTFTNSIQTFVNRRVHPPEPASLNNTKSKWG